MTTAAKAATDPRGSPRSARLDPEEPTVPPRDTKTYRSYLRYWSPEEHAATDHMFDLAHPSRLHPKKLRYQACRTKAWFIQHRETREIRVSANTCRNRWCVLCARARVYAITQNVHRYLHGRNDCRFLTLTLKSVDRPLQDQLDTLYANFKTLRNTHHWKDRVTGGIYFCQLTFNKQTALWHPHLHILALGHYFHKRLLQNLWKQITHGSFIADVRTIGDHDQGARYVARYASRPALLQTLPDDKLLEAYYALNRRKLIGTFGKGIPRDILKPQKVDPGKWRILAPWWLVAGYADDFPILRQVLTAYFARTPLQFDADLADLREAFDPKFVNLTRQPQNKSPPDLDPPPDKQMTLPMEPH